MSRVVGLIFLSLSLLTASTGLLCTFGADWTMLAVSRHDGRIFMPDSRPGIVRLDPEVALARLEQQDTSTDEGLRAAVRTVAAALVPRWPAPGDIDWEVSVSPIEDLPLWLEIRWLFLIDPGNLRARALAQLERERWRNALTIGTGLCSQSAFILVNDLGERGIRAEAFGLDGHVVTRALTERGERILDANLGLMIPFGIDEAAVRTDDVTRLYQKAGYEPEFARFVAEMYGVEGNHRHPAPTIESVGSSTKRRWAMILWWISAAMTLVAALTLRRCPLTWHFRRPTHTDPRREQDS